LIQQSFATYDLPIRSIGVRNFVYSINGNNIISIDELAIDRSGLYAIVGDSGCGKSTLVELLLGLIKPQSGARFINGTEVTGLLSKGVSYVKQRVPITNDTLVENIGSHPNQEWSQLIYTTLSLADIEAITQNQPLDTINLSPGQEQRIGIARALNSDDCLIILDEPTSALDSDNKACVYRLLKQASANKIVVVVTHDIDALEYVDSIFNLNTLNKNK
jgi:ATP-binding cassette subfamily C protein